MEKHRYEGVEFEVTTDSNESIKDGGAFEVSFEEEDIDFPGKQRCLVKLRNFTGTIIMKKAAPANKRNSSLSAISWMQLVDPNKDAMDKENIELSPAAKKLKTSSPSDLSTSTAASTATTTAAASAPSKQPRSSSKEKQGTSIARALRTPTTDALIDRSLLSVQEKPSIPTSLAHIVTPATKHVSPSLPRVGYATFIIDNTLFVHGGESTSQPIEQYGDLLTLQLDNCIDTASKQSGSRADAVIDGDGNVADADNTLTTNGVGVDVDVDGMKDSNPLALTRGVCESRPRSFHTANYLPEQKLVVVFGGKRLSRSCKDAQVNDAQDEGIASLSASASSASSSSSSSSSKSNEGSACEGEDGSGSGSGSGCCLDEVEFLDTTLQLWYPPSISGKPPSARMGHCSGIVLGNLIVYYGGTKDGKYPHNIHVLDTKRWHWNSPKCEGKPPRARAFHSCCAINPRTLLLFGGEDANASFNDVHLLVTNEKGHNWTWQQPEVKGEKPPPRSRHSAVVIETVGGRKYLFVRGGWDAHGQVSASPKSSRGASSATTTPASATSSAKKVQFRNKSEASSDRSPDDDDDDESLLPVYHTDAYLLDIETWEWKQVPCSLLSSHTLCQFEGGSGSPWKASNMEWGSPIIAQRGGGEDACCCIDKEKVKDLVECIGVGEHAVPYVRKNTLTLTRDALDGSNSSSSGIMGHQTVAVVGGGSAIIDAESLVRSVFK